MKVRVKFGWLKLSAPNNSVDVLDLTWVNCYGRRHQLKRIIVQKIIGDKPTIN